MQNTLAYLSVANRRRCHSGLSILLCLWMIIYTDFPNLCAFSSCLHSWQSSVQFQNSQPLYQATFTFKSSVCYRVFSWKLIRCLCLSYHNLLKMIVFIDVLFACCLSANWFFSILFSSQSTAIFSVSYWFRFFAIWNTYTGSERSSFVCSISSHICLLIIILKPIHVIKPFQTFYRLTPPQAPTLQLYTDWKLHTKQSFRLGEDSGQCSRPGLPVHG